MKKFITTIGILTGILVLNSCKKVLDTLPTDRISADIIWSSKANAETFIFSTYGIMSSFQSGPGADPWTTNIIAQGGIGGSANPVIGETLTNRSDYGFNNWAAVRRCNVIIKNVTESTGIADADKKELIAEAKFLRAMSYFQVTRNIGRIVWIDKVLTENDEFKLPTTANPTESYNYIIKDLEDAVADLPIAKISGRTNKYVAAAFLTEVCLQALAYKNYPAAPNVAPNDPLLDKIITNAQLVISGGYALEADYEGMFNEVKSTSNEIIYGIYRKAINTSVQSTPMQNCMPNITADKINKFQGSPLFIKSVPFECWPENFPAQNLTDDYLTIDKADPTKVVPWNQTSQYINAIDETVNVLAPFSRLGFPHDKTAKLNDETLVKMGRIKPGSTESIWTLTNENRDARWKASIISDSTRFYGELFTTGLRGNAARFLGEINGGDYAFTLSNMYWRKGIYTNVSPSYLNSVSTDYHFVCMRLGRVYLNLAEAYLLKGDVANAVINFNKTRVLHGQIPAATASNLISAWKDYKRERRVELTEENDRYYSLLRWGRYGGDANDGLASGSSIAELTEPIRVMDISKDRKAFSIVTGPFRSIYNNRKFQPSRRYLLPIPQGFIDNNPKFLPQNPNW
ncbi:RagB/SusD family nutrient uptake outer membrane protein [Pedobacter nyackensis]|uniref:Starch-binding associating with outer membrane n=1 Tax=Pedobacter nyackensis TaxID=475255 RepID=A0A1W2DK83_9SPHI|nr:RagB/SusD family nutrient uptake outer membrane protein [Pedobacter nyackensis]SMC97920.1 Starch-binding associating with outer membrane [Pedobacter nyackensis]